VTVVVILITIHNVRIATNPHPVVKWVKKGQGGMQAAHTIHSWIYRQWGAAAWELRRKQWDSGLSDVEGGTRRRMAHGQGGGKQTETPTTPEDAPTPVTEPHPAPKPEEGPESKSATMNAPVTAAGADPPMMQRTEPTTTRQTELAGMGIPAEKSETTEAGPAEAPPVTEEQADLGVPREANSTRRGKKNPSSTERGGEHWKDTMDLWEGSKPIAEALGKLNVVGNDLWYKTPPPLQWTNLQGLVVSLNMRGWGNEEGRELIWSTLARTKKQ
jgi:hypothetical protein